MNAAKPDQAVLLYEKWNELLREKESKWKPEYSEP